VCFFALCKRFNQNFRYQSDWVNKKSHLKNKKILIWLITDFAQEFSPKTNFVVFLRLGEFTRDETGFHRRSTFFSNHK